MAARLEILACGGCGAPVPLADAPSVACPACGAAVEIPASYREAFVEGRRETDTRAEARALYAQLGAPPRLLRTIGVVFDPSGLTRPLEGSRFVLLRLVAWYYRWSAVLVTPFALFIAAILGELLLLRAIGAHYRVELETIPSATRDWILLPLPVIGVLAGTIAGVYGRRKTIARERLQAALAARPPQHEGGPSTCRKCGGPLSIDGEALGVRCVYCGADNLVALPAAWLAQIRTDVSAIGDEIVAAHAELVVQQRRLRRSLLLRAGPIALFLGTVFTISLASGADDPKTTTVPPSWWAFDGDPRPLIQRDVDIDSYGIAAPSARVRTIAFDGPCPRPVAVPAADCDRDACTVRLYAALRHDETAALTVTGAPAGTRLRVERHHGFPWPKTAGEAFGERVEDVPVSSGTPATISAPWSAWYELALVIPGGQPPAGLAICFAVPR